MLKEMAGSFKKSFEDILNFGENRLNFAGIGKVDDDVGKNISEELQNPNININKASNSGSGVEINKFKNIIIDTNLFNENVLKHASEGEFTYSPKTKMVSKMKSGGHGQANIDFLEKNNIEYNILKVYDNGVRVGNVPGHKEKLKRTGIEQAWFPEHWTEEDIINAGKYVGTLPNNKNSIDGHIVFGNYKGVRVGIIRSNGKISTIFPDSVSQ